MVESIMLKLITVKYTPLTILAQNHGLHKNKGKLQKERANLPFHAQIGLSYENYGSTPLVEHMAYPNSQG